MSVDGVSRPLPRPFMVAATMNPIEYEGTYPFPEAQLDRFLLKLVLPLPEREHEMEIVRRHAAGFNPRDLAAAGVRPVAGPDDILGGQRAVRAGRWPQRWRPTSSTSLAPPARAPSLELGVSPRGATALLRAAQAWAWLNGRDFVTPDDAKALAHSTLRHRLQLRPEAELEGVDVAEILTSALASVPVPR